MTQSLTKLVNRSNLLKSLLKRQTFRVPSRSLNVHEHISYTLLNQYCIPTPKFKVATTPDACEIYAKELGCKNLVLKAQVLTGGRGVGKFKNGLKGGVQLVDCAAEAKQIGSKMLNQVLVTKQTGPAGLICNKVMIVERKFNRKEYYFAIMMERHFNGPVLIASARGGVSIEEVAAENPDAVIYEPIPIECGLSDETARKTVKAVGIVAVDQTVDMLLNMYDLFCQKDCLLIEINPYAEDALHDCLFFALDAKLDFDDNAAFRQKEIHSHRDLTQQDPLEDAAQKVHMNYIALDGNIGCMVNGAGLAMSTLDIIKLTGGEPANFLDIGGAGSVETIKGAFRIITLNKNVNTIFVNIFAGINKCDVIAEAVIAAVKEFKIDFPIIIRLKGTNEEKGKEIIQKSKLNVIAQNDMSKAAKSAVTLSKIVKLAASENLKASFSMLPAKQQK